MATPSRRSVEGLVEVLQSHSESSAMKPVFRGTFVIFAIYVLLYEQMYMATGQPRIEVSISF